jgi:hypothetical protein
MGGELNGMNTVFEGEKYCIFHWAKNLIIGCSIFLNSLGKPRPSNEKRWQYKNEDENFEVLL